MEAGKHLRMKPKALWETRPSIYGLFKLTKFRKHLDQAKQAAKEFGQTPGQNAKKRRKKGKVGGTAYARQELVEQSEEDEGITDDERSISS